MILYSNLCNSIILNNTKLAGYINNAYHIQHIQHTQSRIQNSQPNLYTWKKKSKSGCWFPFNKQYSRQRIDSNIISCFFILGLQPEWGLLCCYYYYKANGWNIFIFCLLSCLRKTNKYCKSFQSTQKFVKNGRWWNYVCTIHNSCGNSNFFQQAILFICCHSATIFNGLPLSFHFVCFVFSFVFVYCNVTL